MTTVYHVYHSGRDELSFSIHSISDSNTVLNTETKAPSYENVKDPSDIEQRVKRQESALSRISTKIKRARSYDDPQRDPRTETSPYFIHLPKLAFHLPPYTLRHGGQKTALVAALMSPAWGWRGWKLEFGDILSQPGVIDRRGVVSLNHGTLKGEDGTLRGYPVRSWRMASESGKAWFKEQKALGLQLVQESTKAKPEEVVQMKWVSPFSFRTREYRFSWRGYDFVWKGTGKARPKTIFRPLLRFNHLKLVVLVPRIGEKGAFREVTMANYISVASARKMGRLELDQEAMDTFLAGYVHDVEQAGPHPRPDDEKKNMPGAYTTEKTRQRMKDVIVATGMGTVIGEYQKRQVVIGIILAAAGIGGG